ncbi:LOW QUALITY PROTEIN: hypothetical protein M513_07282 [Trichuris suis]|uniref:CCHC-type domain-containing protein n=1 Tax=Trichuris suis TaxID=68888 RepID=A0A085M407_9BILA|nr:LOW QUALITY PROTEIN: hypothetical protein M513_07282 [Trichuris suis]
MSAEQIALAQQRFCFEQFDPGTEEWDLYVQCFECELEAFGLRCGEQTELARRRLLLSKIGKEHFRLLVNHFRPLAVQEQSYDRLKSAMSSNYGRRSSVMVDRVQFSQRFRRDEESVTQFLNSLRGLASRCDFGDSLAERLRDQLVIGINNSGWQQELLRQFPKTPQQVEAADSRLELADSQRAQLQHCTALPADTEIRRLKEAAGLNSHRRHFSRQLDPATQCLRCGYPIHRSGQRCPAEGKKCYACGRENHLATVCVKTGRVEVKDRMHKRAVNVISTNEDPTFSSGSSSADTNLNTVATLGGSGRRATIKVTLNGRPMVMLYDPGACYSVISKRTWEVSGCPELRDAPALVAYTKVPVCVLGKADVRVRVHEQEKRLQVYVVAEEDSFLFGLD